MNKTDNRNKSGALGKTEVKSSLLTSLVSFTVCIVMLISCSYAWFIAVVQGPSMGIRTGTFGVLVEVSSGSTVVSQSDVVIGEDIENITAEVTGNRSVSIEVKNGKTYQIILTPIGEASKGFCVITVGDGVWHTEPLVKNGEPVSFLLESSGDGTTVIQIQPYWGEYREEIGGGSVIGEGISMIGVVESSEETATEAASDEELGSAEESGREEETANQEESSSTEGSLSTEGTTDTEETTSAEGTTDTEETTSAEETADAEETICAEETTDAEETAIAENTSADVPSVEGIEG